VENGTEASKMYISVKDSLFHQGMSCALQAVSWPAALSELLTPDRQRLVVNVAANYGCELGTRLKVPYLIPGFHDAGNTVAVLQIVMSASLLQLPTFRQQILLPSSW
jgi:hypothetical protein